MAAQNDILRYTLLPGILPRIVALFRNTFAHTAYIIAVIFNNVRLIEDGHPYLQPENFARFGIRHVIAQAAANLVYSKKNIDQIVIFYTILAGMVLLVLQFVLLISALFATQPAFAIGVFTHFTQLFENPSAISGSLGPDQDVAFIVLDHVFGLGDGTAANNMYNSCVSNLGVDCLDMNGDPSASPNAYPYPFHDALHQLLRFYSLGLLYVGTMVIIYLVTAVVAETAQTGVPFGQRFNKAWAPVRLIIFFAFLIPINNGGVNEGLNGAQMITFKVVQWGSNLATNAWAYFNTGGGAGGNPYVAMLDDQYEVIGAPQIPEVTDLIKNIFLARACQASYHRKFGDEVAVDAYVVRSPPPQNLGVAAGAAPTPDSRELTGINYADAVDFVYQGNIEIVFGQDGIPDGAGDFEREFALAKGNVLPLCGAITLQIQGLAEPASNEIFEAYYEASAEGFRKTQVSGIEATAGEELTEVELVLRLRQANEHEIEEPWAAAQRLGVLHTAPDRLLLGRHLKNLGIPPGRHMGELLAEVYEAQLEGAVTTLEEAMDRAQQLWSRASSDPS